MVTDVSPTHSLPSDSSDSTVSPLLLGFSEKTLVSTGSYHRQLNNTKTGVQGGKRRKFHFGHTKSEFSLAHPGDIRYAASCRCPLLTAAGPQIPFACLLSSPRQ